jgi:WD40 repeat protein
MEHLNGVGGVTASPDGKLLASVGTMPGNWVCLWDAATGKPIKELRPQNDWDLRCVGFSPDGKAVAAGSVDGVVRLWDVATGRNLLQLTGHRGAVFALAFSADGRRLASASWDGTVLVWDLARAKR